MLAVPCSGGIHGGLMYSASWLLKTKRCTPEGGFPTT